MPAEKQGPGRADRADGTTQLLCNVLSCGEGMDPSLRLLVQSLLTEGYVKMF